MTQTNSDGNQSAQPAAATPDRILAEFEALRSEIEYRTNAQTALISLNITAIGALAGFALSNEQGSPFIVLLVLALLCPSLGLLWVDHAITIENIGDYIRKKLGFKWEFKVRSERRKFMSRAGFVAQMLLLFLGPAIASLVIIFRDDPINFNTVRGKFGWILAFILTFWCACRLLWLLLEPRYGARLTGWTRNLFGLKPSGNKQQN